MEEQQWDKLAAEKKDEPAWFIYYINSIYNTLIKKTLDKAEGSILKTDLWNESIAPERNIINQIKGYKISGMDLSSVVIEKCKNNPLLNEVKQGDIRNIPFEPSAFDFILDISTIDHIPEEDAEKVIKEYSRVLKKGGKVLIIFWKQSFIRNVKEFIRNLNKTREKHQFYYSYNNLRQIILNNRLEIDYELKFGMILNFMSILTNWIYRKLPNSFYDKLISKEFKPKWLLSTNTGMGAFICKKK